MNYIRTFEKYVYEKNFKLGDTVSHSTYDNIKGTVEYGPSSFIDVKKRGYAIDDVEEKFKKDTQLKVWYGISLSDDTKLGIHQNEFKK